MGKGLVDGRYMNERLRMDCFKLVGSLCIFYVAIIIVTRYTCGTPEEPDELEVPSVYEKVLFAHKKTPRIVRGKYSGYFLKDKKDGANVDEVAKEKQKAVAEFKKNQADKDDFDEFSKTDGGIDTLSDREPDIRDKMYYREPQTDADGPGNEELENAFDKADYKIAK